MTATERSENPNAIALPTAASIPGCPTTPVTVLVDYFSIVDN
jgi:Ni,Fe-hydrogenase III small subunit